MVKRDARAIHILRTRTQEGGREMDGLMGVLSAMLPSKLSLPLPHFGNICCLVRSGRKLVSSFKRDREMGITSSVAGKAESCPKRRPERYSDSCVECSILRRALPPIPYNHALPIFLVHRACCQFSGSAARRSFQKRKGKEGSICNIIRSGHFPRAVRNILLYVCTRYGPSSPVHSILAPHLLSIVGKNPPDRIEPDADAAGVAPAAALLFPVLHIDARVRCLA